MGSTTEFIEAQINANPYKNLTLPCNRIGLDPDIAWDEGDELYPVTGLSAQMLLDTVRYMGPEWDCEVMILPSYEKALYATTRMQVCDVGFANFANTAERCNCDPDEGVTSGVRGCAPYNASIGFLDSTVVDACCADFAVPMLKGTLIALVARAENRVGTSSALTAEVGVDLLNILGWILLVQIVIANLLWLVEKTNPDENTFSRGYVAGAFDAVWAVSNGFAGVRTTCGRILGIVWMFASMALFALLAGTLSSVLTSATLQQDVSQWETVSDLPTSSRVCVSSSAHILLPSAARFGDNAYNPPDYKMSTCVADLLAGRCDAYLGSRYSTIGALQANLTEANMVDLLEGTDPNIAGMVFPYGSPLKSVVSTAFLAARTELATWEEEFFVLPEQEDVEEIIDAKDPWLKVEWGVVGVLAAYMVAMFTATMFDNARKGHQCMCARLFFILRNLSRESKLRRNVDAKASLAVEDLCEHGREIFAFLDLDHSGNLSERELEALADALADAFNDSNGSVSEKDAAQIKNMLLELYACNVDGNIDVELFADKFYESVTSLPAQELLWGLARDVSESAASHALPQATLSVSKERRRAVDKGTAVARRSKASLDNIVHAVAVEMTTLEGHGGGGIDDAVHMQGHAQSAEV